MTYHVRSLDQLLSTVPVSAEVSQALEDALNTNARDGRELLHVIPQRQLWDDEGMPNGIGDLLFVFRSN